MIIVGKRRTPQVHQLTSPVECPHCLQMVPILVVGCAEYLHIFYIPFFGWKRAIYICSDCEKTLVSAGSAYESDLAVKIPPEANEVFNSIKDQVQRPWYHFIGLIALAVFIIVMMFSG